MVQHISTEYLTMDFFISKNSEVHEWRFFDVLDMKKQTELNLIPHKLLYKIPITY
jgi:hypothetical protein